MKKSLLVGLLVGALLGFGVALFTLPFGPPRWIVFPDKQIFNWAAAGGDYIIVQGRIEEMPGYPNNFAQITCRQPLKVCEMIKIEQIDQPEKQRNSWPQIGDVDPPELFDLVQWDKANISAVDDGFCEKRQLNIDLTSSEAEIVVQPQNLTNIQCKNTNPNVVRFPLEDKLDPFKK